MKMHVAFTMHTEFRAAEAAYLLVFQKLPTDPHVRQTHGSDTVAKEAGTTQ